MQQTEILVIIFLGCCFYIQKKRAICRIENIQGIAKQLVTCKFVQKASSCVNMFLMLEN